MIDHILKVSPFDSGSPELWLSCETCKTGKIIPGNMSLLDFMKYQEEHDMANNCVRVITQGRLISFGPTSHIEIKAEEGL